MAHELRHFLNLWHEPQNTFDGFSCTRTDLSIGWRERTPATSRHMNQEREANRFAIELLAPLPFVRPFLFDVSDVARILDMSKALGLSREAAARGYVELHPQPSGLVFTVDAIVRYIERHADFPFISYEASQRPAGLPSLPRDDSVSPYVEADARDWLSRPEGRSLAVQTLRQQNGYGITLLMLDDETAGD